MAKAQSSKHGGDAGLPHRSFCFCPNSEALITDSIQQMMYVSGETGEPSVETTGIIEDIVRQQVIELVSKGKFSSILLSQLTNAS